MDLDKTKLLLLISVLQVFIYIIGVMNQGLGSCFGRPDIPTSFNSPNEEVRHPLIILGVLFPNIAIRLLDNSEGKNSGFGLVANNIKAQSIQPETSPDYESNLLVSVPNILFVSPTFSIVSGRLTWKVDSQSLDLLPKVK